MTGVELLAGRLAPRLDPVSKIAVLRANALGDFLLAVPALDALRAAYEEAELVLLGLEWHRAFVTGRPGPVDRVVVVPPVRGVSRPDHVEAPGAPPPRFLDEMRRERFDLALQIHGGGRHSNPFVRSLGARVTAGLRTPDAAPLDRWTHFAHYQPDVLRFLEVVALVGAEPLTLQAEVAVTESDLAEADAVVKQTPQPLVAIHPGASDPRRRWPPQSFAKVADALAGSGARIALTGSARERELTNQVATRMRRPSLDLGGALSLGGLTGLLSRCALVVGNDTGPLHLARAVATPSVAVYWVGNLITAGPVGRSIHRALVSFTLECPVCGMNATTGRCRHEETFVASVDPEEVLAEALCLLQAASGRRYYKL